MNPLNKYCKYDPVTNSWAYKSFIIHSVGQEHYDLIFTKHKTASHILLTENDFGIDFIKMLDWDEWFYKHISPPDYDWVYKINGCEFSSGSRKIIISSELGIEYLLHSKIEAKEIIIKFLQNKNLDEFFREIHNLSIYSKPDR